MQPYGSIEDALYDENSRITIAARYYEHIPLMSIWAVANRENIPVSPAIESTSIEMLSSEIRELSHGELVS